LPAYVYAIENVDPFWKNKLGGCSFRGRGRVSFPALDEGDKEAKHSVRRRSGTPTEKSETTNVAGSTISKDDHEIVTNEIEKDVEKAQPVEATSDSVVVEEHDPNIVWWDSEDDPANPMNWSLPKKWTNIGLISAITFIV
jgi:hypothetical protein